MDKYIAFNLYKINDKGGHSPTGQDGELREVYLAADVDKLIKEHVDQKGDAYQSGYEDGRHSAEDESK